MKFDRADLKAALVRANMYQYDFAKELNITESHLSKILRGRVRPSNKLIAKILAVLKEKELSSKE